MTNETDTEVVVDRKELDRVVIEWMQGPVDPKLSLTDAIVASGVIRDAAVVQDEHGERIANRCDEMAGLVSSPRQSYGLFLAAQLARDLSPLAPPRLPWGLCSEASEAHPPHDYKSATLGSFRCTGRDANGHRLPRAGTAES